MNTAWAVRIMNRLAAAGVEHVAVCPGSRSTPLSLAAQHHPNLRVQVVLDERDAGFWAVGVAKAKGQPSAVITTSGTAVANLLPAAVEASNAAVPLILLTADRPASLRDKGTNQTIHQEGIFGAFVRFEADLPEPRLGGETELYAALDTGLAALTARCPGPVHFNQPFHKPLEPTPAEAALLSALPRVQRRTHVASVDELEASAIEGQGVIVAGPGSLSTDAAQRIHAAAKTLGAPILADPLSGLRIEGVICHYDAWIDAVSPQPDWIVQFGAAPTSKSLGAWLLGLDGRRIRIDETGRRWDEGSPQWVDGDPVCILEAMSASCNSATLDSQWSLADGVAANAMNPTGTEAEAVLAAVETVRDGVLFIGNSLAVRDLDRYAGPCPRVIGNRGASGIDGNLATLAGIATTTDPVLGVIGDLAFQHDVGGLALLAKTTARLVVVSNGGGAIFRHLPIAKQTEHFESLFLTPQAFDIASACAAFGLSHIRVPVGDTKAALASDAQVVEVVVDGESSAKMRRQNARLAAEAAVVAWRQS